MIVIEFQLVFIIFIEYHCAAFVEMSSGILCEDEKAAIRARQNFMYKFYKI